MAQGKKSFIAYADWKDTFDELPNEDAGALIKHIFAYVNDENPISDSVLIRAIFANIKSTLKRDLDKWDSQLQQRSNAGKKSAESRALNKNNERSTVVEIRERNPTDSVSVSVSDTVTEIDNEKSISNSIFKNTLLKNENWKKTISTHFKITDEEVVTKLNEFYNHLETDIKTHPNLNEFAKHFKNWIPVNKEKNGNNKTTFAKNR